jgi:hypothetical protein
VRGYCFSLWIAKVAKCLSKFIVGGMGLRINNKTIKLSDKNNLNSARKKGILNKGL